MQAEEAQRQAQQQQWNAEMAKQVSTIQPWAPEFGDRWYKKISIGTLVYADYGYYHSHRIRPAVPDSAGLARSRQQQLQLVRYHAHLPGFQIHAG